MNSNARRLGLKNILCTPHCVQVKFIQTILYSYSKDHTQFFFFPNRFVSGHKFSISGQATLYNLVNSVLKTCLKSKEKGSDNGALSSVAELKCTFFDSVTLLHFGMKLHLFCPSNLHLKCFISISCWINNDSTNQTLASVKPPWFFYLFNI